MIDVFTKQEKVILIFIIAGLLIGAGIRLFFTKEEFVANSQAELNQIKNQIAEKSQTIDSLLLDPKEQLPLASGKRGVQHRQEKVAKASIDINTADFDELLLLPNIGPVLANRIIEYRKINGKFNRPEELLKVKGIGKKKFSSIIQYIKLNHK